MGGCIGVLYIETHKQDFKAAVLSSPMLEPALGFLPKGIAESILDWKEWIGREEEYVPLRREGNVFEQKPNTLRGAMESHATGVRKQFRC
jgi:hypothetical protein